MNKRKIIIIAGPTAVGKTALAISIAKKIDGEIISADSMQIYKQMNIGTAKVTAEETLGIMHHLIDIVNPNQEFSVADYAFLAKKCIEDIISRGKVPILVGGTGLYISSVVYNMDFNNSTPNESVREKYNVILFEKGPDYLFSLLSSRSKEAADSIHPNNIKRVIRALEILDFQNDFFTFKNTENVLSNYCSKIYILSLKRELLYNRINIRVDTMIENGLVNEVKKLIEQGLKEETQSMKAIGYRQIIAFLNSEISFEETIDIIKRDSRRYAKRQLTWFKKYKDAMWLDVENFDIEKLTEIVINDYNNSNKVST